MKTHTPGPWHACCPTTKAHYIFAQDCEITICQPRHNDPALDGYESQSGIVTMDQRLANARLIAASPRLLNALLPFANYACDVAEGETCDCHNCEARAAIREATGQPTASQP